MLKTKLEMPVMQALNAEELLTWCKDRKKFLGITNEELARTTGVPEGTINRLFSGNAPEYRYSTIQPIIAALIGLQEDTPEPEASDKEQPKYYYDTIEGFKLIIEEKNYQIEKMQKAYDKLQEQCDWMRDLINNLMKGQAGN